jgi:asparagine synthase (glutamine-hydrolysing)
MCGIAGIYQGRSPRRTDDSDVATMTAALSHRGPDRAARVTCTGAVLGSARLAIVDLANSQQPMSTPGGRYKICLNGEIFNYAQLRRSLERDGVVFRTKGDTEVALHALARRGPAALATFEGQFALAFYDEQERRLILARDRYGICPLYFTERDGALAFSSELRSLQTSEFFRADSLDGTALLDMYILWGFLPGRSAMTGMCQVDPACWLEVSPDACVQHRYWSADLTESELSPADAVEQVASLLKAAVERRLAPEVKLAVLLSGGLDSSAVSALASRSQDIMTFGIGFANPDYDESAEQWAVARHLGTDHHTIRIETADLVKEMHQVIAHSGMPLTRTAPVATYMLARELALHDVRVVLTGEGADEMMLGYDIFKLTQDRAAGGDSARGHAQVALAELPAPERARSARGRLSPVASDPADPCFSHLQRWESSRRILLYLQPDRRAAMAARPHAALMAQQMSPQFRGAPPLRRAELLELMTFLPTMLLGAQSDRMLMAHSIEGRYPFLDNALVDALFAMPISLLSPHPREKELLRRAIAPLLPAHVCARPKQAYTAPLRSTLSVPEARPLYDAYLSDAALEEVGLFDPVRVRWLLSKINSGGEAGGEDARAMLFMLTTQMLHAIHIKPSPSGDPSPSVHDRAEVSRPHAASF